MKIKTTYAIALEAADISNLRAAVLTLDEILDTMESEDIPFFPTERSSCTKNEIEEAVDTLRALAFQQLLAWEKDEG